MSPAPLGPKARFIPAWGTAPCVRQHQCRSAIGAIHRTSLVCAGAMERAFSPLSFGGLPPGAVPQAGMKTRRWHWDAWPPLPAGEETLVG